MWVLIKRIHMTREQVIFTVRAYSREAMQSENRKQMETQTESGELCTGF